MQDRPVGMYELHVYSTHTSGRVSRARRVLNYRKTYRVDVHHRDEVYQVARGVYPLGRSVFSTRRALQRKLSS